MELKVNGKPMQVEDGTSAAGLLQQLAIRPERVVVEVNLEILKREQLGEALLKPGDEVEIVHFVGGGSASKSSDQLVGRTTEDDRRLVSSKNHGSRFPIADEPTSRRANARHGSALIWQKI